MKKIFNQFNSKLILILLPFLKKFFIATQIIFYIVKYYLDKGFHFISSYFQNKVFWLEFRGLLPVVLISFFIYYFIIIELSILVFGYSLLCY
ncbi:hypothetical protein KA001_00125 [Patescibacteria group bacterium]|nr:hypothetical protein [Patescibacteria group bacterium]